MFDERTTVGLDVHARSVVAEAVDWDTGQIFSDRLVPTNAEVLAWVRRLPGPVAVTYEAGPTGFGLSRALTAACPPSGCVLRYARQVRLPAPAACASC